MPKSCQNNEVLNDVFCFVVLQLTFLVRSLINRPTIETFLKSSAASISSITYIGVGRNVCKAKTNANELSVFSPPDKLQIRFQDFFGGRILKENNKELCQTQSVFYFINLPKFNSINKRIITGTEF